MIGGGGQCERRAPKQKDRSDSLRTKYRKKKKYPRPTPVRPNSIHRVQEQQQPSPHHTNQPNQPRTKSKIQPTNQTNQKELTISTAKKIYINFIVRPTSSSTHSLIHFYLAHRLCFFYPPTPTVPPTVLTQREKHKLKLVINFGTFPGQIAILSYHQLT